MHESELVLHDTDICEYTKAVIRGLLIVLGITVVGAVGAVALGDMLAWWAAVISTGVFTDMSSWSLAGHFAAAIITVAGLMIWASECYMKYSQRRRDRKWAREAEEMTTEPAPPGMLVEMYQAWKLKYCVKITVKITVK